MAYQPYPAVGGRGVSAGAAITPRSGGTRPDPGDKLSALPQSQWDRANVRRDATENRLRLIEAASAIMRESGGDVPLEAIAERAGVTRGTMYRNFADRFQLYLAVLDREIDLIRLELQGKEPCGLFELMRRMVGLMDVYEKFHYALPQIEGFAEANCRLDNLQALVDRPLAVAQAAGIVRADLTSAEVLLACRMIAVGWRLDMAPDRIAALERRFRLVARGLGVDAGRIEQATPDLHAYERIVF
ncbi:TetR/AcrR family transcriptional regulator [Burkholderia diffusa]|uniref:TetR/AcrR family transcriptional regulator n=1 Tax=Burkholderia diffusa TaxID=488732 RepID=UPI002651A11B|nr:TetR/AcrR family transcriptional regulator [Burkholderia diffusa]MDN7903353.1 TetR/AcrR family transcriptional regulator [Burkholderia diffusa]